MSISHCNTLSKMKKAAGNEKGYLPIFFSISGLEGPTASLGLTFRAMMS